MYHTVHMTSSIGSALRAARQAGGKSLNTVASAAGISAATLSRIETEKQSVDVALLISLARILNISASDILRDEDADRDDDTLVTALAARPAEDRARIVSEASRRRARSGSGRDLAAQLDSLLATMDLLREELLALQKQARPRR